ncbi:MAG: hypothetical protein QNI96_01235 [Woeseiaceae bacterium]|nr:hypothetical protein [Woeseiaceae bacterium]
MEPLPVNEPEQPPTWTLIRDAAVLQVKLIVDGLRDLLLVPASLVAAIISLVKTTDGQPGDEFYRLVSVGKQSERWINLFGALRNAPAHVVEEHYFGTADIDEIVTRVESFVVDEYQRGGVTKQAHDRLNEAIERMRNRKGPTPPP